MLDFARGSVNRGPVPKMGRMRWYLRASTFGSPFHAEQGLLSGLMRPGSENHLCGFSVNQYFGYHVLLRINRP